MLNQRLAQDVMNYVNDSQFKNQMDIHGEVKVSFLAQGEYNLNYLLETSRGRLVLRINTASQMKIENQIAYEYNALKLLSNSNVTPKPYYLDDGKKIIPFGLLVMEYLPGNPLDYSTDLQAAAQTFARIHGLPLKESETKFLVKDPGPFAGIYNEAFELLDTYFGCPEANPEVKRALEQVLLAAEEKKKFEHYLLQEPWLTVINTEVNSHNFIVNQEHDKDTCHLIDWEKPILGEPAQDLSMFLIPTTTLWKRNYRLTLEEEKQFLKEYLLHLPQDPYANTLMDRVQAFKFFNLLRAISWCAMAWTEYTKPGRPLMNLDTFKKINFYLELDFIRNCFN
jgi:Ser/Thr protein kinase RdoA (MazF antagonist)